MLVIAAKAASAKVGGSKWNAHSGPVCKDGSLDMRAAANKGEEKWPSKHTSTPAHKIDFHGRSLRDCCAVFQSARMEVTICGSRSTAVRARPKAKARPEQRALSRKAWRSDDLAGYIMY